METILITGASGFVGTHLSRHFLSRGFAVIGLGTSPHHPLEFEHEHFTWFKADTSNPGPWQEIVQGVDTVINLAGRSIFQYWTKAYKDAIYQSRVATTRNLVAAMAEGGVLVSTSAVGFYGDCGEQELTEVDPAGSDFLARVCLDWESEALVAQDKGIRVCIMRLGVVLGQGGALLVMAPAFKLFLGGPLGNGKHYFPWIHLHDLRRGVEFFLDNPETSGAYNFTGPELIRQKTFAREMGRALGRPAFLPAPGFVVKTAMGELGASLLQSQKARPEKLTEEKFEFLYPTVGKALGQIYSS